MEKGKNLKNTCKLPCGKSTGIYWKAQDKKSKVITIKRKVVVCTVTTATPTLYRGTIASKLPDNSTNKQGGLLAYSCAFMAVQYVVILIPISPPSWNSSPKLGTKMMNMCSVDIFADGVVAMSMRDRWVEKMLQSLTCIQYSRHVSLLLSSPMSTSLHVTEDSVSQVLESGPYIHRRSGQYSILSAMALITRIGVNIV